MPVALPPERMAEALAFIAAWRGAPDDAVPCPVCAAPGLRVADHSARPFAEWYALRRPACGLEAIVHVPLAGPMGIGE